MDDYEANVNGLSELSELNGVNVGFRLLHKKDQTQSSAILFLQWCVAPQVLQHMKSEVTNAVVLVTTIDPKDRKTRYIFRLTSPQELLEFHCSGVHHVFGVVAYGSIEKVGRVAKKFLKKSDRFSYEESVGDCLKSADCHWLGNAHLSVEVADGFFAPKMSSREEWYVNLWFSEPAWDECEIRRRRIFAYTIQSVLLAMWVPFTCFVRAMLGFWLSVFCLKKGVAWEAVVHPFEWKLRTMVENARPRRKEGSLLKQLFLPAVQLAILFVAAAIADDISSATGWSFLTRMMIAYGSLNVLTIALVAAVPIMKKILKLKEQRAKPVKEVCMDNYADLFCTTAPMNGTLRPKRSGIVNNVVLAYHDLKAAVCRPTARQ